MLTFLAASLDASYEIKNIYIDLNKQLEQRKRKAKEY